MIAEREIIREMEEQLFEEISHTKFFSFERLIKIFELKSLYTMN